MANDWWQKGSGLDLWSIPHFLFGILMGFLPPITGVPLLNGLTITVLLALLWEIFEKIIGVKESVQNILIDILLSLAAFSLTSFILLAYPLHPDDLLVGAAAIVALYAFTNFSGWRAYRRRKRDFMH